MVSGGLFHGIQLWVNLPAKDKMMAPRYQDIRGGQVQLLTSHDGGALLRVIAGELDGHEGPGVTHTPISLVHATLAPGAEVTLPWREDFNGLAYVLAGRGSVGPDRRPIHQGQTAVFGAGSSLTVRADEQQDGNTPDLEVVLLGGQPIREPMAHYGPFVMNTRAELEQAFEDFQKGGWELCRRCMECPRVVCRPQKSSVVYDRARSRNFGLRLRARLSSALLDYGST